MGFIFTHTSEALAQKVAVTWHVRTKFFRVFLRLNCQIQVYDKTHELQKVF